MNIKAHLPALRKQYPVSFGGLDVKQSQAEGGGESLQYWWDHEENKHGYHYHRVGDSQNLKRGYYISEGAINLTGQIAMSRDGYRVIGQHQPKGQGHELIELPLRTRFPGRMIGFLQRWGWLPCKSVARLPAKAEAFALGPDGQLAVALGKDVQLHTRAHGLTPWKTFQEPVCHVGYLEDGTMAVVTQKANDWSPTRHEIWLHAPDGSEGRVSFKELHPESYGKYLEGHLKGVAFLKTERTPEESEGCLERLAWLRNERGGWAEHAPLGSSTLLVLGPNGPSCWTVDPSTGEGKDARPLEPTAFATDFKQKMHTARDGRYLLLEGPNAHVWDTTTGKLHMMLPGTGNFHLSDQGLSFKDRDGMQHAVSWEDLPKEREQDWYSRTLEGLVLDSAPVDRRQVGIRVALDHINVGGTKLRRRVC